jgi:hypothetical protein
MAQCHQHSADSVRVRFLGQLSLEAVDWSTDSLHRAMRDSLDPYPTLQCWSRSQSYNHASKDRFVIHTTLIARTRAPARCLYDLRVRCVEV